MKTAVSCVAGEQFERCFLLQGQPQTMPRLYIFKWPCANTAQRDTVQRGREW